MRAMEAVLQFCSSASAVPSLPKPSTAISHPRLINVVWPSQRLKRSVVQCASKREKPSGSGFGTKTIAKPSFDAGVLLKRSEQLYSRLLADYSEEGEVREFVICVRERKATNRLSSSSSVLDDWLPVAELALVSEQDSSLTLPVVLPIFCREVAECAAKGAVALRSISRSALEYAYEPAEHFYQHVVSGSNMELSAAEDECPYAVLGLNKGAPASEVRVAYRSLAATNHPDRQFGTDPSVAEVEFKRVTNAYDKIKRAGLVSEGAARSYASLGGTARNGLSDPIIISSSKMSSQLPDGVKVAVRQLHPDVLFPFLNRSYARSGGGGTGL